MGGRKYSFCVAVLFILILYVPVIDTESCEESMNYVNSYYYDHYHHLYIWPDGLYWHNMTMWDGHFQIPWKDTLDSKCGVNWGHQLVLTGKHPDISTLTEEIVTVKACGLNQNGVCEANIDVQIRKCYGDFFCRFHWSDIADHPDILDLYTCYDRIYTRTCEDKEMVYSAGNESGNLLQLNYGDLQIGWYSGFINGKQYVFPSTEDLNIMFNECFFHGYGYVLKEPLPQVIEETPLRLFLCWVDYFFYQYDDVESNIYCDGQGFIYVRACNGKLEFDLSRFQYWVHEEICMVHHNNIIVKPEIDHDTQSITVNGKAVRTHTPFLQYRCSFNMIDGTQYKTNWYINGTFQVQTGPSSRSNDLVFKEEYLKHLEPGYEVQCGVITVPGNESSELLSDVFYAGWKIADNSISLSKSGYKVVDVEQTIPLGCYYRDDAAPDCVEELMFEDSIYVPGVCAGGIRVQNADDASKSVIEIQSLKKGEEWTNKKHRAKLTTIDSDYDDKTAYDLRMSVTRKSGHASRRSISTEAVGDIHVDITETNRHWNKRCYSHVDPHMKTTDGEHYEAQEEGDYMMAWNEKYQTEIQTSARYCYDGYVGGPVCACGIAIAVGADVFIINKCPNTTFRFDFVQCGDGGIIDVEEIHAYRYKIRTPIGTLIDIILHTWSGTMNIDIFMSAKDFGNTVGLCGFFDGDRSNDLLHRDNITISDDNNWSYKFADSWRLIDEENLFKDPRRNLKPWNVNNGGTDQPCSRSHSITRKKCNFNRRTRRATSDRQRREVKTQNMDQIPLSRKKRSTGNFTAEEAFSFCNHSIYTTAAVQEFPDKLAEEDPDKVVEQCVYDLTRGNDTAWVEAHTIVLNNAADTILGLNPVYVANNTNAVNSFRLQTCLNNCSGNGVCTETGLCDCNGIFRGPDCSIDIRIPPVVYYIEGDGICEITAGDDCSCFQIRTDNIFDGFMCDINKSKVYFNGTRIQEVNSTHVGDYQDIFTGECCAPAERKKRTDADEDYSDELFVVMYEFAVSNDGVNYGETNAAFVYDTTCLQQVEVDGNITFQLKTGYCFIDAACVVHNSKELNTDECLLCDPLTDPYSWTEGSCEESSTGMTMGALIGIICGSLLVAMVSGVLVYLLCCKSKKPRTVGDVQSNFQSTLANIHLPVSSKNAEKSHDIFRPSKGSETSCTPDTVAKPAFRKNMWISSFPTQYAHMDSGIPTIESSFPTQHDHMDSGIPTIESSFPTQHDHKHRGIPTIGSSFPTQYDHKQSGIPTIESSIPTQYAHMDSGIPTERSSFPTHHAQKDNGIPTVESSFLTQYAHMDSGIHTVEGSSTEGVDALNEGNDDVSEPNQAVIEEENGQTARVISVASLKLN